MPITNYYSVNGELIGEKVGTNARVDYLTDALGNVTATLNQSGQVINTYRYKPYGGLLAKTGAGADPAFQWVGAKGYRQTEKKYSDVYVRARHYDTLGGRWTSNDPVGMADNLNKMSYVRGKPSDAFDYTGLFASWAWQVYQITPQPPQYSEPPWSRPCNPPKYPSWRPCVQITKDYINACNTGHNGLDCCASCISAMVCDYIIACDFCPAVIPILPVPVKPFCEIAQCQNSCMADRWRLHDTQLWKIADVVCKRDGFKSYACCVARVTAEQSGYTLCASRCGVLGFPFNAWGEKDRIKYAIEKLKCCGVLYDPNSPLGLV